MKKFLLSAITLLSAGSALAVTYHPFLNASVGRDIGSWGYYDAADSFLISSTDHLKGWDGNFSAGFEFDFGKFALAPIVTYGAGNSDFSFDSTAPNADANYYAHHYFALGVMPSYEVSGQSLFAKVMASWAKLEYSSTIANLQPAEFNHYDAGVLLGLGVLAPVSQHFAISSEYNYDIYGAISKTGVNGNVINLKPRQMVYALGLSYYFGPRFTMNANTPLGMGFYMAAGGGPDEGHFERCRNRVVTNPGVSTNWEDQGLNGLAGQMLVGYRHLMGRHLMFGLEAMASYTNAFYKDRRLLIPGNTYKYHIDDMYGGRGLLGYNTSVSNDLFFLGGFAVAQLSKSGGTALGQNFDSYHAGWQVGLGDEVAFTSRWSGRIEYDYARFSKEANTGTDGDRYQWTPVDERFLLSFIYAFGGGQDNVQTDKRGVPYDSVDQQFYNLSHT